MPIEQLKFTMPELLSLLGVAQCVYIMTYMAFRAGDLRRALLPFAYFMVIGIAFFLDFGARFIAELSVFYEIYQWFFWFLGPPLSVLLIIQIARIQTTPDVGDYWVLFLTPLAYVAAVFMSLNNSACIFPSNCAVLHEWLVITGLIAGTVSLLAIWKQRGHLDDLHRQKKGQERYWLILMLIFMNLFFLAVMLASLSAFMSEFDAMLVRTCLGLGLVYLAGTSLFRIYPQAIKMSDRGGKVALGEDELALARRIERLMDMDKVYHEPAYSRTDLAQELGMAETMVSRVINIHFGKTFPQLLNERRVEDAKRLLVETKVSIKTVAEQVGFNSTASFNRVFRDMVGLSPSGYRTNHTEDA